MAPTIWSLGWQRFLGSGYLRALGGLAASSGPEGLSAATPCGQSGLGVPGTLVARPAGRPKSRRCPSRAKSRLGPVGPWPLALLAALIALVPWGIQEAYPQSTTSWKTTAVDGSWGNTNNWDNGVPDDSKTANFTSSNYTTINIPGSGFSPANGYAAGLVFSGGGEDANFTISSIYMLVIRSGGITVQGGTQTFNVNLRAGVSGDFPIVVHTGGSLDVNDTFMAQPDVTATLRFSGGGNVEVTSFSRRFANQNTNLHIVQDGQGTLTILQGYPYQGGPIADGYITGTTTINGGVIAISAEACLGGNPGGYWQDSSTWIPGSFNPAALTLNGGTLRATASFTIDDSNRGVTLGTSGGAFDVPNSAHTLTIANPIAGAGSLTKTGAGTLVLSGQNTYTGTTTVSAGILEIQHASALGASGTGQGTTVASGATLRVRNVTSPINEPITIAGDGFGGSGGALRIETNGTTWAGPITIQSGSHARIQSNSGTFYITGGITGTTNAYLQGQTGTQIHVKNKPIDLGNAILYVMFGNTVLIEKPGDSLSHKWGTTWVTRGSTLKLLDDEVLPSTALLVLGSDASETTDGTLDMNGKSQTISGLKHGTGPGTRKVINSGAGASTLTINNTADYTFAGVIQDNINLVKQGTGTQTLSGANTYTGTTTVSAGTLALSSTGNNNIPNSPNIRIDSDATLNVTGLAGQLLRLASGQTLQGNGTVQGNVEAPAGSFLGAGMSPGHLTITGNYTQAGTLLVELAGYQQGGTQAVPGQWQANGYDWVSVGGSAVLDGYLQIELLAGFQPQSGDTFDVLTAAGGISDQGLELQWDGGSLLPGQYWTYQILTVGQGPAQILQLQLGVPEPSGLVLLALGALGLWLLRRRLGR